VEKDAMSHIPVNHHLRPVYRALTMLAGAFILVFGVVGAIKTAGDPPFSNATQDVAWVFGMRTNFAFAVLSIVAGIILVASAALGRNVDHFINIVAGLGFMVVGMLMLGLMRTDANFLAFAMTNVIISFIIGLVVFAAGLYGKTGTPEQAAAEQAWQHGS
jgi:hypothetical protein